MTGRDIRVLWAAQFLNTAALMVLVPVMPFYVARLGASSAGAIALWSGVALAAPALMLTVTTPLWGAVGDRVGRKWMVVRALIGLALSMGVMAAAQTPVALVLGRLLQGTVGGVVEAASAFVAGEAEGGERGRALGRSYSATAAGAVVGPLFGGAFVAGDGIRVVMLATAALAVLAAGVAAVQLGHRRDGAGTAPAPRLRRVAGELLRAPGAAALFAAAFAAHLAAYGMVPVFAIHLGAQLGDASAAAAWVGLLHALTWGATIVGSLWWGRRNDRVPSAATSFVWAAALCTASLALQALPTGPEALIPVRLLQGFAFAALAQSVLLEVSRAASPQEQSARVGVANSFLLAGQVAGPLLVGLVLLALTPTTTILLLAAVAASAAVLAWRSLQARGLALSRPVRGGRTSSYRAGARPVRRGSGSRA